MTNTTWTPPTAHHHITTQPHADGAWYATCTTCGWSSRRAENQLTADIFAGRHHHAAMSGLPKKKSEFGKFIVVAIAGFIAIVAIGAAGGSSGTGTDGGGNGAMTSDDMEYGAFDVCQQFVKRDLKAPSTAKFRNYFEDDGEVTVSGFGDGPYTVRSSVDAQNGFGADIRTNFSCTVEHVSGTQWRLVDLTTY